MNSHAQNNHNNTDDLLGIRGQLKKGDEISNDNSTVRKALFAVLAYLIWGILIYSWWFEGWDVTDAIYFSIVTLMTVGYGDMGPTSDGNDVHLLSSFVFSRF